MTIWISMNSGKHNIAYNTYGYGIAETKLHVTDVTSIVMDVTHTVTDVP